jgi:hypothetical protein
MSFPMVVVGFPLLLALLALGAGLLVERLAGVRLPFALLPALGFATLVVVSQFTTWPSTLAPATPWILLALALGGFALAGRRLIERWRSRRGGWWLAPGAGLATYLTVSAPVLAAGRLTFPGYLLDTTGAIQLAGAERLLHHGRDFTNGFAGYGATLVAYFGHGYPSGGHTVFAATGWLSGQDLLWLYAPYQAMELAFAALVLAFLAERAGLSRAAAALAGWMAAVPALVYAYALMGSVKELTALPLLLLMGALVVLAAQTASARGGVRTVLPFAVAGAAALGAIGIAASPWVGLFALAGLAFAAPVLLARRRGRRALGVGAVALAGTTAVLGLPTLGPLSSTLRLATSLSGSNAAAANDPGNLLRPLRFVQTLGVWLGESHRADPRYLNQSYALIGIVAVCAVLGLSLLVRRRAWALLAFVAVSLVVWEGLTRRGTEWTDAKVLMLLSPVAMLMAMVGAFRAVEGHNRVGAMGRHKVEGVLLAGTIAIGVLGSDALAYHGTGLAPTQRYSELRSIGQRFAGQGPTFVSDFDEYTLYLLRNSQPNAPGIAYHGVITLANGSNPSYGHSYDLDAIAQQTLQQYRLIVMRRSPAWSRPPGNFALVWNGPSYEVWRRVGAPPKVHLALGAGLQPVASAPCRQLRGLARVAQGDGGRLEFAARAANIVVNMAVAAHSPNTVKLSDLEGEPQYQFIGPARVEVGFRAPRTGRYELWLGGNVDRPLRVLLDGRLVGSPSETLGGDASKYLVGTVNLRAGRHDLQFIRGGGSLRPGDDASTLLDGVLFEPVSAEHEIVSSVAPSAWRSLCGRELDWVEVD